MTGGHVLAIYLRPRRLVPVVSVLAADAVAGRGLRGDHAHGGRRQLTLLARERWCEAVAAAGAAAGGEADFGARRANVVLADVDLGAHIGQVLYLGVVAIEVLGETTPCARMEAVLPGLRQAMSVHRRGGVFGRILRSGRIAVGDAVVIASDAGAPARE